MAIKPTKSFQKLVITLMIICVVVLSSTMSCEARSYRPVQYTPPPPPRPNICPACACCGAPPPPGVCCACCSGPVSPPPPSV
ncbi:Protein transport protein SEC31 [Bienertia sinuspersici]